MLKVWGRKSSSNVQALMWCVGELGLPYERVDVGHTYGGNDTQEFLAMNPNGTVPVVRDGDGQALWETGAICALAMAPIRSGHLTSTRALTSTSGLSGRSSMSREALRRRSFGVLCAPHLHNRTRLQ